MKKIILITSLFMSLAANQVFANQTRAAEDNDTINFYISNKEYSRIIVTNDRILSVKGQRYLYEIKEFKSADGELFIKPSAFAKEPFSIFISTENGHHYTLNLESKEGLSQNIEIKPMTPIKLSKNDFPETNDAYTQAVVRLMKLMANQSESEDYAVTSFADDEQEDVAEKTEKTKNPKTKQVKKPVINGLIIKLNKAYRGKELNGEIWLVTNRTNTKQYLNAHELYKKDTKALSVLSDELKPNESTLLYRVF